MKLLEKLIYSTITFVVVYVVLSMILRMFELTSSYASHMVGGIVATVLGVGVFMTLLMKKPSNN